MEIIEKLKQNADDSRRGSKISLFAKMKEDRLLKKISIIIGNFMSIGDTFGYDFSDKDKGFIPCLEYLIEEANTSGVWQETTYTANALGAGYLFAFLIIDNYPNSFNFKEFKGKFPHLVYVGDAVDIDIGFNLVQTMYDILKGERDISKLDTIYNLCDALYNGTVTEETIDEYLEDKK